MSRLIRGAMVVVAALACVAMAAAQVGGGGGGQGRRGGGQGRRGNQMSELGLAMRHDVQVDLAVTDDQKTKLQELQDKQRAARGGGGNGGGGNGGGGNGGGNNADRQAQFQAAREQAHKDLAAILNDGQMKRLGEIMIQLEGNRAILRAEVQTELGLSADQVTKIKDLQTKQQEASTSIREKVRSQEMTREEATAANQKNAQAMNDELGKILTSDQAAKLKTLGGKPFTADPPTGGGGGN